MCQLNKYGTYEPTKVRLCPCCGEDTEARYITDWDGNFRLWHCPPCDGRDWDLLDLDEKEALKNMGTRNDNKYLEAVLLADGMSDLPAWVNHAGLYEQLEARGYVWDGSAWRI